MATAGGELAPDNQRRFHPAEGLKARVLLDARKLGHGGIGVYLENVIAGLLDDQSLDLTLLVADPKVVKPQWQDRVSTLCDRAKLYSVDELFLLPRRVQFRNFDLFHVPHYTLPFGVPIPSVITIHDLIHIRFPERWYYPMAAGAMIRSAVHRASRVIAVSKATADDLNTLLGTGSRSIAKVRVVPNAVASSTSIIESETGSSTPYLLAVLSNLKPHKDPQLMLEAFVEARAKLLAGTLTEAGRELLLALELRVVGLATATAEQERSFRAAVEREPNIIFEGEVSAERLAALYRNALSLLVSSRADGFCLPALEAKACGTPVIARPVPAVLEFLNQRDYIAADFTKSALVDALARGIEATLLRRLPRAPRYERENLLSRYSIKTVGESLRRVYQSVLSGESALGVIQGNR